MIWFLYGLVAGGHFQVTRRKFDSLFWPISLGRAIGRIGREAR